MRRAFVRRIMAVLPYYGYTLPERKIKARDLIWAKLVANFITANNIINLANKSPKKTEVLSYDNASFHSVQALLCLKQYIISYHYDKAGNSACQIIYTIIKVNVFIPIKTHKIK